MSDITNITASCNCRASNFTFSVPISSLPLSTYLCHCNISRRISGALCTSYVDIPLRPGDLKPDLAFLTAYKSSDILTRYFCSTCGTQMYLKYNSDGHLSVSTGSLDKTDGVVKFLGHMWIEDTKDGGASEFITTIGGEQLKRWFTEPKKGLQVPPGWKSVQSKMKPPEPTDKLCAHCHCNGVRFWISRPSEQSKEADSPFPDLLIPYHSGSPANPSNQPWWIPEEGRFLAGSCACVSCRQSSGFDITWWTFIPITDITLENGEPFRRYFGAMKSYRSSPHCTRTFCAHCGCTVFWDSDERPSMVDVALGMLDAESGTRAEEWLNYQTERVSFTEFAGNRELTAGLEEGLKTFGQK
ncbi:hypothetical protein K432DRAFT_376816 [Lepidopterella palustris CBS 459.81]|uniref:CENP-V/GFA domain-containing protein n=1 Tax=Lepidopterella palustris CBS 459.81 TaxID=1314670 RepID=A0A8E2JKX8_9PEZI|nr:hypothetical protein K432DRAFT_376816 [Lepidopterella palustris CBS 459.81]